MADIRDRCRGMTWPQVRDEGLLSALAEACGGPRATCKEMGWHWNQHVQRAISDATGGYKREVPKVPHVTPEAQVTGLQSNLTNDVYRYLKTGPANVTVETLADRYECAPRAIRGVLAELGEAGYVLDVDDSIRLTRTPSIQHLEEAPGWGESRLSFGYVTDTHLGNLCACTDELEWLYDKFEEEGVLAVLHSGDLSDGAGDRPRAGGQWHAHETRQDCQTRVQIAEHIINTYPRRDGLDTYFIESDKSHDGWEFAASGFSGGQAVAEGFTYNVNGPDGLEKVTVAGRDDMKWLGYTDATLLCGPEHRTRIHLHHPDGGTAYALSYTPQKWAEMIEGGTKPHVGLLGHYHKHCWISPRNVQVLTGGCMCWQTPFMRRKRLAAHVCGYIIEMAVDADGSVREFTPRQFPFYRAGTRYTSLPALQEAA